MAANSISSINPVAIDRRPGEPRNANMNKIRSAIVGAVTALLATSVAAQDKAEANIAAGADGFSLRSGDGQWSLRVRGLLQVDGRAFDSESSAPGDDEWLLRRVRPTLDGTFGDRVSFRLMPDFGGGRTEVPDAYVDLKLAEDGPVIRAGKFKPPVGLERLRSANHLQLIERSIVTELVPRRDIGVQISGTGKLEWAAGLFNGVVDGGSGDEDPDGKQELAVRLLHHPFADEDGLFKGLALGIAGTHGSTEGTPTISLLNGYRSPGQKTVFNYRTGPDGTFATGERTRVSPQAYWYRGPFGVMAEAVRVNQDVRRLVGELDRADTLDHDAWQLTFNWFLTGETAGFRDPNAVGAIELVARASTLKTDEDSFVGGAASYSDPAVAVRRADTKALGVNWFPLAGIKASLSYQQTAFAGGSPTGDRTDERVLLARLQLYF
jgi:phosphate-selective porin OprO and OprP